MRTSPRPLPPPGARFIFPYRLVLQDEDGPRETLDPAFLPFLTDLGDCLILETDHISRLRFGPFVIEEPGKAEYDLFERLRSLTHGQTAWIVERVEDEREYCIQERDFERDPAIRMGTVYSRPAKRQ